VSKILIFGAGKAAEDLYGKLPAGIEVLAFVDNDKNKQGMEFQGRRIISPAEIDRYEYDCIVIASMYELEIIDQLIDLDIKPGRVCSDLDSVLNADIHSGVENLYKLSFLSVTNELGSVEYDKEVEGFIANSYDCRHFYDSHFILDETEQEGHAIQRSLLKSLYKNSKLAYKEVHSDKQSDTVRAIHDQLAVLPTPYVVNFNQGDMVFPEFLELAENLLDQHPDVGVIFSNKIYIDSRGRYLGIQRPDADSLSGVFLEGVEVIDKLINVSSPVYFNDCVAVVNVAALRQVIPADSDLSSAFSLASLWGVAVNAGCVYLDVLGGISKKIGAFCSEDGRMDEDLLVRTSSSDIRSQLIEMDRISTTDKQRINILLD